jgi:threonine 3-dehydrogenase
MKAAFFNFKKNKFLIKDVPVPALGKGDILVKIAYSALCGTDLHVMYGILKEKAYDKEEMILGHAWSGIVEKTGLDVKNFTQGDKIFGADYISCGKCPHCKSGKENLCDDRFILGMELPGTHAEYAVIPAKVAKKLPDEVGLEEGCFISDVLTVVYHAIKKHTPKKNSRVGIYGAGPIGLATGLMLKKVFGVKKIYLTEPSPYRRNLAKKLFQPEILKVQKETRGYANSFDIVYEASGNPAAFASAIKNTRRGGYIILIGVADSATNFPTTKIISRELSIMGSFIYDYDDLQEVLKLVRGKKIRTRDFITHKTALKNINRAYGIFGQKKTGGVVLRLS